MSATASAVPTALYSGWLTKRAVRSATKDDWKRRWVVLRPTELSYYENDKSRKPKNTLTVTPRTRVRRCDLHRKFEMEVYFGSLAFYAAAEDEADITDWIDRIQTAIVALKPAMTDGELHAVEKDAAERRATREEIDRAVAADMATRAARYAAVREEERDRAMSVSSRRLGLAAPSTELMERKFSRAASLYGTGTFDSGAHFSSHTREVSAGTGGSGGAGSTKSGINTLYTWGAGDCGQLGDGRVLPDGCNKPSKVEFFKGKAAALEVAAGVVHAAVITSDGRLFAWGSNESFQLGHGTSRLAMTPKPLQVSALRSNIIISVACGATHTLCVALGGGVWSWGTGVEGQLGLGPDVLCAPSPTHVTSLGAAGSSAFAKVVAGRYTSAALTADGCVYAWGGAEWGRLGFGPDHATVNDCVWAPSKLTALADYCVTQVALGDHFSAFLVDEGELLVTGALGVTAGEWRSRKQLLTWPHHTVTFERRAVVSRIAAGRSHLAIIADSALYMAGRGWLGRHDTSSESCVEDPIPVPELDLEGVEDVACGSLFTLVRTGDGRLYSFGHNTIGALGLGHNVDVNCPAPGLWLEGCHHTKVVCGSDFALSLVQPGSISVAIRSGGADGHAVAAREPDAVPSSHLGVPHPMLATRLWSPSTASATGTSSGALIAPVATAGATAAASVVPPLSPQPALAMNGSRTTPLASPSSRRVDRVAAAMHSPSSNGATHTFTTAGDATVSALQAQPQPGGIVSELSMLNGLSLPDILPAVAPLASALPQPNAVASFPLSNSTPLPTTIHSHSHSVYPPVSLQTLETIPEGGKPAWDSGRQSSVDSSTSTDFGASSAPSSTATTPQRQPPPGPAPVTLAAAATSIPSTNPDEASGTPSGLQVGSPDAIKPTLVLSPLITPIAASGATSTTEQQQEGGVAGADASRAPSSSTSNVLSVLNLNATPAAPTHTPVATSEVPPITGPVAPSTPPVDKPDMEGGKLQSAPRDDMILPPGWSRYVDEDGDPYYFCVETGEASWLLFWELCDDEGTSYYVNCETGGSQWERPSGAVIVVAE